MPREEGRKLGVGAFKNDYIWHRSLSALFSRRCLEYLHKNLTLWLDAVIV